MDPEIRKDPKTLTVLDPDQKEAVFSPARHTLVVAGPGSGKTRVLASRFAQLIKNGCPPGGILALTFTNRAALEMKKRVLEATPAGLGPPPPPAFSIGTFHSFALKFIKDQRPGFSLYGRVEQVSLMKELDIKNPEKALEAISTKKNFLFSGPTEVSTDSCDLDVFDAYEKGLKEKNALDLDDLILETIRLLLESGAPGAGFSHVLVDEYQDINPPQAHLVRLLTGGGGTGGGGGAGGAEGAEAPGLFAIGDPDQAIYSFRGANLRGFSDFVDEYPGGEVRTLGRNYRSSGTIVTASRSLIEKNPSNTDRSYLRPIREGGGGGEGGEAISIVDCPDERGEAEFVIKRIEAMMGGLSSLTVGGGEGAGGAGGGGGGGGGYRFSDFAVLIRTNRQARVVEEVFRASSVPFQLIGPPPELHGFIEHIRGKGLPAEMKLSFFIESEGRAFGLDPALLSSLVHTAASLFDAINDPPAPPAPIGVFIEHLLLMQPADTYDIEADRVSVMTLHMAKGLEFPVVFVTGMEEGIVPLRIKGRETDVEEERRLFYVGITRAKEKLFLLAARKRRLWGKTLEQKRSPFLAELPAVCVKEVTIEKKQVKRRPQQKGLFE